MTDPPAANTPSQSKYFRAPSVNRSLKFRLKLGSSRIDEAPSGLRC